MNLTPRILRILLSESPFTGSAPPHIFCDVDGVLANFDKGLETYFGVSRANVDNFLMRHDGWSKIAAKQPRLFAKLPMLPGAKGLINGLVTFRDAGLIRLSFLTAIPEEWYNHPILRKSSTYDKIEWVTRHFQKIPAKSVLVVRRADKQLSAQNEVRAGNPPPVLIDDYSKNIREWERAGGLGIQYQSSQQALIALQTYLE